MREFSTVDQSQMCTGVGGGSPKSRKFCGRYIWTPPNSTLFKKPTPQRRLHRAPRRQRRRRARRLRLARLQDQVLEHLVPRGHGVQQDEEALLQ